MQIFACISEIAAFTNSALKERQPNALGDFTAIVDRDLLVTRDTGE
jgi:hypothetical protein